MTQEYLRVKQVETGHELSITRAMYDFAPEGYELLEKPATDAGGNPLPAKHKTTVAAAARRRDSASTRGQQADTDKENP